jgi:hypothetical protein
VETTEGRNISGSTQGALTIASAVSTFLHWAKARVSDLEQYLPFGALNCGFTDWIGVLGTFDETWVN